MEKSTEQNIYEEFLTQFKEHVEESRELDNEEYEIFYAYGPLSDSYWTSKPRILVCNLEAYDEREGDNEGRVPVDIKLYKEWMGARTGKNTARFIAGLITNINKETTCESIRDSNLNDQKLLGYMSNVAYINFRLSSGKGSKADYRAIWDYVNNYGDYYIDQIKKLSPDIIIIGGKVGCEIYNSLYKTKLNFNSTILLNGQVVCSIRHPSRINYKEYDQRIIEIGNCYQDLNKVTFSTDK